MITHLKVATKDVQESEMEPDIRIERSLGDALHRALIVTRREIAASIIGDIGATVVIESKLNIFSSILGIAI